MSEQMPVTRSHKRNPLLKSYDPGPWMKFYPKRWLTGTLRTQNDERERAFWIDILSMAATSTYPGIIAASKEGREYIGYPLGYIAGALQHDYSFVAETLGKFQQQKRLSVEVQGNEPDQVSVIRITNYRRYQSEYQRQKPYREAKREQVRSQPPLPGMGKHQHQRGEAPPEYLEGAEPLKDFKAGKYGKAVATTHEDVEHIKKERTRRLGKT